MSNNPMLKAAVIAETLRNDPVAAAQVRELIPVAELARLLDLDPAVELPLAEALMFYDANEVRAHCLSHTINYVGFWRLLTLKLKHLCRAQ